MEDVFRDALQPMPPLFRRFVNFYMVDRLRESDRVNRALEGSKDKEPQAAYPPEWRSKAVLRFFLRPLWNFFFLVFAVLFLICCFFWSLPFFK